MSQWSSVKKFNQVSRGIVLYRQPSAREIAGAAKRFWTQETLCRNLKKAPNVKNSLVYRGPRS
ncbi:hypothetical protein JMJ77_0007216 [Colletotrichum scovillei]|uniref:Uncharacterized protein n=1 Tax=Colletotrichum scovillei TaxID=1209932 RepID=A0A9P7RCC6_9PEZI|nr:hypothetical protein JMJ77_0007216 [Colletotrichum scovillei]KAG7074183.1 hypothetical protein JMJ76_0010669 [Colletotrichum scovillei]KAG7081309.1 hypothetical protein JMJ78_0003433 [Colletotrichum scovillei]